MGIYTRKSGQIGFEELRTKLHLRLESNVAAFSRQVDLIVPL